MEEEKLTEIKKRLAETDWDDITPRLTAYALWKIKQYYWQGTFGKWSNQRECILPGGMGPGDYVNQAVMKVMEGKRQWDSTRHPDLFEYLKGIISSDISADLEGKTNRKETPDRLQLDEEESEESIFDKLSRSHDPRKKLEQGNSDFCTDLYESLADEPILQKVIDLMMDGLTKPKEMSESLEISVREINNLQKKLRRRAAILIEKQTKEQNGVEKGVKL